MDPAIVQEACLWWKEAAPELDLPPSTLCSWYVDHTTFSAVIGLASDFVGHVHSFSPASP